MSFAVRGWAEAMAAAGIDVVVASDDAVATHHHNGVEWVCVPHSGSGRARAPRGLERFLETADLLVIHSAWLWANSRAAAASRKADLPYMVMPHGGYDPHILHRRAALKKASWLAFESKITKSAAAAHLFFDEERAHLKALGCRSPAVVAPNGVSIPPGWSWDGGSGGYLAWLGRLDVEHKGLDLLVEAIAGLPPGERPPVRIFGTPWRGGHERLEQSIGSRGVQDWVRVFAPVYGKDKWRALSQAAGFIYPSRWEACSISILEAAAIGLPILATPYPLSGYLSERNAALVVDRSPAGLREGLTRLRDEGPELAGNARRCAEDELSWPAVTSSWVNQVQGLLGTSDQ